MKPQLRLSIVVVLLSYFCLLFLRQSIAEAKSPEFLYALSETDKRNTIHNGVPVVSDMQICGYHIGRKGELQAVPRKISVFAGTLARLRAKVIARPEVSLSAFGPHRLIVIFTGELADGGAVSMMLIYNLSQNGTPKLLSIVRPDNNTSFMKVEANNGGLYVITINNGNQHASVVSYGMSSSGTLTKKWRLAENFDQIFIQPSCHFLYCVCDPGLSNVSSEYGSLAIYTYRIFTDKPPILQGRCFLPSYFRVRHFAFNPDGRTAYATECYGGLYQFRILHNGVLRNLHPESVSASDNSGHFAAAFLQNGRRMYIAGAVASRTAKRNLNCGLTQWSADAEGRLSTLRSDNYSRGYVWSIGGNAAGTAYYTANGLGHAITRYSVLWDGTIKSKQSYVLKSNIVPALTLVSPSPQLNHRP